MNYTVDLISFSDKQGTTRVASDSFESLIAQIKEAQQKQCFDGIAINRIIITNTQQVAQLNEILAAFKLQLKS